VAGRAYAQSVDYTMGDAFTALLRWPVSGVQGLPSTSSFQLHRHGAGHNHRVCGSALARFRRTRDLAPSWLITQLFRNSPWLVLLFIVMLA
jgi:polar amino acid transport system permease protein